MRKKIIIAVLLAAVLLVTSACAGKGYDSEAQYVDDYNGYEAPAPDPRAPYEMEGFAVNEPTEYDYSNPSAGYGEPNTGTPDTTTFDYGGRKVIKTGSLSLETTEFDKHYAYIIEQVSSFGGYLQYSNTSGRVPENYGDAGRSLDLTIRIPADRFDAFMTAASTAGTLLSTSSNAEDITAAYFDIETRLEVLNVQHDRLLALLEKAEAVEDIIVIESELANVTLQIEQLTSELRRYDGLVDYATVQMYLRELSPSEGATQSATVGERMASGFVATMQGVGEFFVDLGIFLVSAIPVFIVLAVIAVVVIIIVRVSVRRSRAKKAARIDAMKNMATDENNDTK